MKRKSDIISISGGYWSGSSALILLLSDNDDFEIVDQEFSLFSYGQFFNDLENGNEEEIDSSIVRFEYFNKTPSKILGPALRFFLRKINFYYPKNLFYHKLGMVQQCGPLYKNACNLFISKVKSKTSKDSLSDNIFNILSSASSQNNKHLTIYFDQLISITYFESSLKYIPNLKLIFVDRDWKDQYVELRPFLFKMYSANKLTGLQPLSEDYTIPFNFQNFFKDLRTKTNSLKKKLSKNYPKNFKILYLEDIIKMPQESYDNTCDFLNFKSKKISLNMKNKLHKSTKNIGKWKNSKYINEINSIENLINNDFY